VPRPTFQEARGVLIRRADRYPEFRCALDHGRRRHLRCVASARIEKSQVHLLAIHVMQELRIDISEQTSKAFGVLGQPWDYVITVCAMAKERCPTMPDRTRQIHWNRAWRQSPGPNAVRRPTDFVRNPPGTMSSTPAR
jgi:protein-tyrosine-phosphatase